MTSPASWTLLHTQLQRTLKQRSLLQPGQRLLVAVSGGQDSLCLAKLLLDLQPTWGWNLAIAHCDHRWSNDSRVTESVRALAQSWQVPFFLQTAEQADRTEAGARTWRYHVLSHLAQQHHYTHVLTGHTASDRAETLLYNLVRGSGADGLQALTWNRPLSENVTLIRPLLNVVRAETAAFCEAMRLSVWQDPSNQDLTYARNRIRQELLPYLSTHFNPQVELALAQTANLLQAEVAYLESEAATVLQRSQHPSQPGFNRAILRHSPLALQRRAIRQFLQAMLPTAPNFEHIEKLVELLTAPNRSQTDPFPGGAIAQVDQEWIWLRSRPGGNQQPEIEGPSSASPDLRPFQG